MPSPPPAATAALFPFPTPAPFATLMDLAGEHATDDGYYDWIEHLTCYDFMFDFTVLPGADGIEEWTTPSAPLGAPPEFVTFGGMNGVYFGYAVPAPELDRPDHPVGQFSFDDSGVVQLGADTRAGFEFLLSRALRRWRDEPGYQGKSYVEEDRRIVARLARKLDLHPDPDRAAKPDGPVTYEVPPGWRHEPTQDGLGVLAPAGAFADRRPVVFEFGEPLDPVLDDAARLLDAGHPASALLALRNAFATDWQTFGRLLPLWQRAYLDLGRPTLAEALDLMAPEYG